MVTIFGFPRRLAEQLGEDRVAQRSKRGKGHTMASDLRLGNCHRDARRTRCPPPSSDKKIFRAA